jgi:hypothetical protein
MDDFLPQTTPRSGESRRGHEANNLVVRGLIIFAVSLAALTIVVELALTLMMHDFARADSQERALAPPELKDDAGLFPAPRLQADPSAELAKLKRDELDRLGSYGWVDERAQIAHIPIDRALDILVERGLPKATSSATKESSAPEAKAAPGSSPQPPSSKPEPKP